MPRRRPLLRVGAKTPAVRAMQNGLHRALAAKGLPHANKRNGSYGHLTVMDVNRFKSAYKIRPVNGKTFGSRGWAALQPFLGKYDKLLIADHYRLVAKRKAELEELRKRNAPRAKLVAVTMRAYALRYNYFYRQYRKYASDFFSSEAYYRTDCSAFVTLMYKAAGLSDPNGRNYDGYGFTGTLWARGNTVSVPQPGDLVFYGYMDLVGHPPSHVAICVAEGAVVSFGSTPIKYLQYNYRSDIRGYRSYL